MSKSKQTSNKKDREKQKQSKKQDKALRKEQRSANSDKGKSLEEMMVYVDEFGRLTSTPPDPARNRSNISADDIQISTPKQKPIDPADLIRKGSVTFFDQSKGYGFIRDLDSQESIFVHISGMIEQVGENDKVTFEVERGPKGLVAVKVKIA